MGKSRIYAKRGFFAKQRKIPGAFDIRPVHLILAVQVSRMKRQPAGVRTVPYRILGKVCGMTDRRQGTLPRIPFLSTIHVHAYEMGQRAVDLLVHQIKPEEFPAADNNIPYTYVERGSC